MISAFGPLYSLVATNGKLKLPDQLTMEVWNWTRKRRMIHSQQKSDNHEHKWPTSFAYYLLLKRQKALVSERGLDPTVGCPRVILMAIVGFKSATFRVKCNGTNRLKTDSNTRNGFKYYSKRRLPASALLASEIVHNWCVLYVHLMLLDELRNHWKLNRQLYWVH